MSSGPNRGDRVQAAAEPVATDATGTTGAVVGDRPERPERPDRGLWTPERRRLTAGLVLTVTLVAFESLAISTVMPEVADDLGGLGLYGWVFSGFFLGSLLGIVVAGQLCDERGTALPFVLGLSLFAGGLVVGGAAQSMLMLVVGRVAQGIGAGAIPAVAYAAVGRAYPGELRPRVLAVFSTAWVVPGLVGPVAAASIAEAVSWRAVFWALLPFAGIAAAMTLPALTRSAPVAGRRPSGGTSGDDPDVAPVRASGGDGPALLAEAEAEAEAEGEVDAAHEGDAGGGWAGRGGPSADPERPDTPLGPNGRDEPPAPEAGVVGRGSEAPPGADGPDEPPASGIPAVPDRRRDALVLVAGVTVLLAGLGGPPPLVAALLVVAGGIPAVWAFLRLVPAGTIRLDPGMPAAVAVRGILTFAFFGADLYVSLAVTDGRGASTWLAGAGLTSATLLWTTGSWVQQRIIPEVGPRWLVQRGFLLVAVGIVGMLVVLQPVPVWLVVPVWGLGGLGMGISYAPLSVTVLSLAAPGEEGTSSASMQLTDVLGVSLGTGLAGVFVALGDGRGWATTSSLTFAFVMTAIVAAAGFFAAGRLPARLG